MRAYMPFSTQPFCLISSLRGEYIATTHIADCVSAFQSMPPSSFSGLPLNRNTFLERQNLDYVYLLSLGVSMSTSSTSRPSSASPVRGSGPGIDISSSKFRPPSCITSPHRDTTVRYRLTFLIRLRRRNEARYRRGGPSSTRKTSLRERRPSWVTPTAPGENDQNRRERHVQSRQTVFSFTNIRRKH